MYEGIEERVSTGDRNLDLLVQGGFPRGSLILLAGNPGVGKTVFSANFICRGVKDFGEAGIYVSLAEDKDTFYRNISSHFGIKCEECKNKDMCIFLDYATVKEEGMSAILESIVEEIMRVGAKRLVIDSFTAMAQSFKDPFESRIILHTILGKIVRRMGCTTLLICEVPFGTNMIAKGMEEFVADGVILLRASKLEERLFRDLEIKKMRGTFIEEKEIAFTLKGGFQAIPTFKHKIVERSSKCKPLKNPPGRFATASPDLNSLLEGGFPSGSTAFLEIAENISLDQIYLSVILPLQWNFIGNGQPVLNVLSPEVNHKMILANIMWGGFSEDELEHLVRFVEVRHLIGEGEKPYIAYFRGKDVEKDLETLTNETLRLTKTHEKPLLLVLSVSALTSYYDMKDSLKIISALSTVIRDCNSLMLTILGSGFGELNRIISIMAGTHLKIIREHGAVFIYGVKPRTPLHAVEVDVSQGYPTPKLIPMV